MNAFDYLFSQSKELNKDLVLGATESAGYREIYDDSLRIAGFLVRQYGTGNNIILISDNSVFFIKSYLGILKSGNVCIPLNPSVEPATLAHIRELTACECLFHKDCILPETAEAAHLIGTEEVREITRAGTEWQPGTEFDENRTAAIMFTSGSTGRPKGVVLSHGNIMANTDSIVTYLGLTSADIIGVVLPFYYCYGLSLLHTHLRAGGSVVLSGNFIFLASVIRDLKNYRCTGFAGVPSHYQILLRKFPSFKTTTFPHLRYVTQAGGKLHDVFIEEFRASFPEISFFVMYGQTEATARLAYLPPADLPEKLGSVGKAIPGVTLKILRRDGTEAEVGETGEIVARGKNIMKGYYQDPLATAITVIDGWLHTGDLGRTDADGFIYLVGRKKEIIKVGGQRVSPKEIEEVILSVPGVIDCTVEGVYDELLGEAIKATVVVPETSDRITKKAEILNACKTRLSLFKIPQVIGFQENMQVSSTGKKVKGTSIF